MILKDFSLFEQDLPVVKKSKIRAGNKSFHPEGLYSQKIFGPVKNYECECGQIKGKIFKGQRCPTCGVLCESSDIRSKTFAQINLPENIFIIFSPLKYILNKIFSKKALTIIYKYDPHLDTEAPVFYYDLSKKKLVPEEDLSGKYIDKPVKHIYDIKEIFELLTDPEGEYIEWFNKYFNFNKSLFKYIFMNKVIVTPPDTRPIIKINSTKESTNDITRHYSEILKNIENKFVNEIYLNMEDGEEKTNYMVALWQKFQKSMDALYQFIIENKLGEKESDIRQSIIGKTIEFSTRAVIICSPNIPPYKSAIGEEAARKTLILEVIHEMLESGDVDLTDSAEIMQLMLYSTKGAKIQLPREEFKKHIKKIINNAEAVMERPPALFMYNDSVVEFDDILEYKYKIENWPKVVKPEL